MWKDKIDIFDNKKFKIGIFIVLIINIIAMILLVYAYTHHEHTGTTIMPDYEAEFGFENSAEALKVTMNSDDLSVGKISKSIESFAIQFLPYINENVLQNNEKTLQQFFKENKNYIYQYAGIEEESDFLELCNGLKQEKCNISELKTASFINDTAEYSNNKFKIDLRLIDKDNNSIIVRVTTSQKSKNRYKYQLIKE